MHSKVESPKSIQNNRKRCEVEWWRRNDYSSGDSIERVELTCWGSPGADSILVSSWSSPRNSCHNLRIILDGYAATLRHQGVRQDCRITCRSGLTDQIPSSCKAGANAISVTSRCERWSPLRAPEEKSLTATSFESVSEIHELSCVCAKVGMLLIKKTRITSEMSTTQADEPGLLYQLRIPIRLYLIIDL